MWKFDGNQYYFVFVCVCVCVCVWGGGGGGGGGGVQLDNLDEQAAQIRRELDGRLQMADQIARVSLIIWSLACGVVDRDAPGVL